jgi:hypothetical protein
MSGETELRFSAREERTLAGLLDDLVPGSDGGLPGAGELGLVEHVAQFAQRIAGIAPVIAQGLAAADRLATARNPAGFVALSAEERRAVTEELSAAEPAFFPTLTFVAYVGYYQQTRIVESLGLEHRPPHPQGYEMEPSDLSLLDPVRRRGKLYREV